MIKTSLEFEKEFILNAQEKTGNTITDWLTVLKTASFSKQQDIINWLKNEHYLNHMQASLLAGIYLNNGKPVYQNKMYLLEKQFVKCELVRSLFEFVSEKILANFRDAQLIPKRSYISYAAISEFAVLIIKPSEVLLGMSLGTLTFDERFQRSEVSGSSLQISHMVVLSQHSDFNNTIIKYLRHSYNRTHNKTT